MIDKMTSNMTLKLGVEHNYELTATQATELQACRHTGVLQNYKLTATQAAKLHACYHTAMEQNYKLAATQATKLQACCHTGIEQNYKLTATQATKIHACCHTGVSTKQHAYLLPQRHSTETISIYSHTGNKKLQTCCLTGILN